MAQYIDGTVDTTAGSTLVSGLNTQFTLNVQPGQLMRIGNVKAWFEIADVVTPTSLHLASNFPQTLDDVTFVIVRDFTPNRGYPEVNQGDLNSADIITRTFREIDTDAQFGLTFGGTFIDFENDAPVSPSNGDVYIVGPTPSSGDDFFDHANEIATFTAGSGAGWTFLPPEERTWWFRTADETLWIFVEGEWFGWSVSVTINEVILENYLRKDGQNGPAQFWIYRDDANPHHNTYYQFVPPATGVPARMEFWVGGTRQNYWDLTP